MPSLPSRRRGRASAAVALSAVLAFGGTLVASPVVADELTAVESVDTDAAEEFPADPLNGDRTLLSADHILISGSYRDATGTVSYQTSADGHSTATVSGDVHTQHPVSDRKVDGQWSFGGRTDAGRLTRTVDADFAERAVIAARVSNPRDPAFVQILTKDDLVGPAARMGAVGFIGVGNTYVLAPHGQSIALEQDPVSANLRTGGFSADALGDSSALARQWSAIGEGEASIQLVNRADGTCLSAAEAAAESRVCRYESGAGDGGSAEYRAQLWHVVAGNQLHTESGLALAVTTAGAPVLVDPAASDAQRTWDLIPLSQGTSAIPPASSFRTPTTPSGFDIAVGDADATIGADGITHDEVVLVRFDAESRLSVAVIDYNANAAGHLVTETVVEGATAQALVGATVDLGDVDKDGIAEIVVTYQNGDGTVRAAMLEYRAIEDGRRLGTIAGNVSLGIAPHEWYTRTDGWAAYTETGLADFDGDGALELAVMAVNQDRRPTVWYVKLRSDGSGLAAENPIDYMLDQYLIEHYGGQDAGAVQPYVGWSSSWSAVVGSFIPRMEGATRWDEMLDDSGVQQLAVMYRATNTALRVSVPGLLRDGTVDLFTTARQELHTSGAGTLLGGGFARGGGGETVNDSLALVWYDGYGTTWLNPSSYGSGGDLSFGTRIDTGFGNHTVDAVAFDRLGDGVLLGEPSLLTVEDVVSLGMVGGQPPGHADWLDGGFVNVSRNETFTTQLGSSDTTSFGSGVTSSTNDTHSMGGQVSVNGATTLGPKPASLTLSGSVTDALSAKNGTLDTRVSNLTYEQKATLDQKTLDDDIVNAVVQDFRVYRYPVYDPDTWGTVDAGAGCQEACYPFWDVLVPGEPFTINGGGKSLDFFAPSWQNGNALSYPELVDGKVDLLDLGSYTYANPGESPVTVTEPLSNQYFIIGGVDATQRLNATNTSNTSDSEQSTKTWDATFGVKAAAKGTVHVPGISADAGIDASFDANWNRIMTDTTTATVSASHGDSFELHVPAVDGSNGYGFGAAYYFGQDGSPRVSFGVDLTGSNQSRQWWQMHYGLMPDPALNLPFATELTLNSRGVRNLPVWSNLPNRQEIRGFEARRPHSDDPLTSGAPFATTPFEGDAVVFDVGVHNHSLVDMTEPLTVDFYAVRVDASNLAVQGEPIPIGRSQVDRIDAQSASVVSSPEWQAQANGPEGQTWRIFVVLDADQAIDEVHELDGAAGEVCPAENVINGKPLIDPMTGQLETLTCGQNNRGYGVIAVQPAADLAAMRAAPGPRAGVTLTGAGVLTGDESTLRLDASSRIPSVVAGQPTVVLVRADAERTSMEHQMVIVYEGDPADGNVVATTTMQGVRDDGSSVAAFRYLPHEVGLHQLHVVIRGTASAGDDQAQVIRLRAAEPDDAGEGGGGGSGGDGSAGQGDSQQNADRDADLAITGVDLLPLLMLAAAAIAAVVVGLGLRHRSARRH